MTDQHADDVQPRHVIRRSSGCGQTFFDADGRRRQTGAYLVRIWCDCGWTGMEPVETISDLWRLHNDGTMSASNDATTATEGNS